MLKQTFLPRFLLLTVICNLGAWRSFAHTELHATPAGELGILCTLDSPAARCFEVAGDKLTEPLAKGRFTWHRREGKELIFGSLAEPVESLDLAEFIKNFSKVRVSLAGTDRERWPAAVSIDLQHANESRWQVNVPADRVSQLESLVVAPGNFRLTVAAALHLSRSLEVEPRSGKRVQVVLQRLPLISGSVLDAETGLPLLGATVATDTMKGVTLTEDGQYQLFVDAEWPARIRVAAAGFGQTLVAVPAAVRDTRLPPVALKRGATLHLGVRVPAKATILIEQLSGDESNEGDGAFVAIAHGTAPAGESEHAFQGLADRQHRILIEGREPLQRFVHSFVPVAGEETMLFFDISPFEIELDVQRGGKPVRLDLITLMRKQPRLRSTLPLNGDGAPSRLQLWQEGEYQVLVRPWGSAMAFTEQRKLSALAGKVLIEIPDTTLELNVVGGRGQRPIANALVITRSRFVTGETLVRGTTSENGGITLSGLRPGGHELSIVADGYLDHHEAFSTTGTEGLRSREIRMIESKTVDVTVVGPTGVPVIGASVVHDAATEPVVTDVAGRVQLQVPANAPRTYWFLPREGSFTYSSLAATGGSKITVVLPSATASLLVATESESGGPVKNVGLLVRYDGQVIPAIVRDLLRRLRGYTFETDASGRLLLEPVPPGVFELWPVFDYSTVKQGAQPPHAAAARIAVQPGLNSVVMSFRKVAP